MPPPSTNGPANHHRQHHQHQQKTQQKTQQKPHQPHQQQQQQQNSRQQQQHQRGTGTDVGVKANTKTKTKTRSRNGCPQCKAKRLKCDETKPECLMCQKNGRKCPGYSQSFRWSTKYEKSLTGKAKGPSNLSDLVDATSKAIPHSESADPSASTDPSGSSPISVEPAFPHLPPNEASASLDASILVPDGSDGSLPPLLDSLILPEYDYGIQDLLQDIWQDDPQPSLISPVDLSKPDSTQIVRSPVYFSASGARTPNSIWTLNQPFSPLYQPIFSQIPRTLNDNSSLLVEEWFRHVCPMWSSFDSDVNLNRKLAYETWTRSEAVMYCLQSMSATCLSSQMPQMRHVAISCLKGAISAIQTKLQAIQSQSIGSFPTDVLLALCCVGTAACWIDTKEIGAKFLREAKSVLKRMNRDSKNFSAQDRQMLSFFNNSVIYWNMLVAVVSDEQDTLGIPRLKEPENKELSRPIVPHPWTGISATAQRLFTQAVRLCRRFRRHHKQGSISTMRSLQIALKDIEEAQAIEEELLELEHYELHEISDTGDTMSPRSHFVDVAEGYRLASLLQLYQTFPDLVARRLPRDALESAGCVPWDSWIVPLSLRLVETLKRIPVTSGTRCIQPLLYLSASTGLRFDMETLLQQQQHNSNQAYRGAEETISDQGSTTSPDSSRNTLASSIDSESSGFEEPQISITKLSIEVTYARRFVMERLSALEHSLPPAPVLVAKDLVKAIWAGYDSERPGTNYTHWIDVMEDSDLRTIFG
ncbi:fungal-specific transcription factor domain-containing protein [Xylariales sp. PMI_506]|nr:fungal-specific transcription factor domain-containing protein [Xylariales sp. PMI_506]